MPRASRLWWLRHPLILRGSLPPLDPPIGRRPARSAGAPWRWRSWPAAACVADAPAHAAAQGRPTLDPSAWPAQTPGCNRAFDVASQRVAQERQCPRPDRSPMRPQPAAPPSAGRETSCLDTSTHARGDAPRLGRRTQSAGRRRAAARHDTEGRAQSLVADSSNANSAGSPPAADFRCTCRTRTYRRAHIPCSGTERAAPEPRGPTSQPTQHLPREQPPKRSRTTHHNRRAVIQTAKRRLLYTT